MRLSPRKVAIVLLIAAVLCAAQVQAVLAQASEGQYSVSGRVYDANHHPIPNAKVTIYNTKFTLEYVATDPVKVSNNPQSTGDGSTSLTGLYQFSGLTQDVYIVTAEKDGMAYSETVQVKEGTTTADITIPGYVEKSYSSSPKPTPTPAPTFTNVIPPITEPIPDIGAILFGALRFLVMAVVALQFVAGIAIIAIRYGQAK